MTAQAPSGFDTLAVVQRLEAAGFSREQAEAQAEAARDSQSGLATKADVDKLRGDMAALETRLQAFFYRTLWIQTGVIAGVVVAIVKLL